MSIVPRRLWLAAGLAGGLLLGFVPAASAVTIPVSPVHPYQVFVGLVNGSTVSGPAPTNGAVGIQVSCLLGRAEPGQTVEVAPGTPASSAYPGNTGSAGTSITAELIYTPTPTGPTYEEQLATFSDFGVAEPIPISVTMPCSGSGEVLFVPSPTSSTAESATVPVVFVQPQGIQPGIAAR